MLGHIMWVIYNGSLRKPCMMLSVILPASNECEHEASTLSVQVIQSICLYLCKYMHVDTFTHAM